MTDQSDPIKLPHLREHDFHSATPVIGPLISRVRRGLYSITAKWAIRSLIEQQNKVIDLQNRRFKQQDQYLHDLDERLIAQDRDLARLARSLAEIEIRQHYQSKSFADPVTNIEPRET